MLMKLKRCPWDLAWHQKEWHRRAALRGHPKGLWPMELHADGYSYEWVDGREAHPEDLPVLLTYCAKELWGGYGVMPIDSTDYLAYVNVIALKVGVGFAMAQLARDWPDCRFTPVSNCHGDLTLENVVVPVERYDTPFVFIDPGYPRGLPCRELDEAKLMQSLEEALRCGPLVGFIQDDDPLVWLEEKLESITHRTLLLTHYIRLLRHAAKHPAWRVEHARWRIQELCQ